MALANALNGAGDIYSNPPCRKGHLMFMKVLVTHREIFCLSCDCKQMQQVETNMIKGSIRVYCLECKNYQDELILEIEK
jgi:hypothetical protein